MIDALWQMAWRVDSRIEPFGVGVQEFEKNNDSPFIGIARREGVVVPHKSARVPRKLKLA